MRMIIAFSVLTTGCVLGPVSTEIDDVTFDDEVYAAVISMGAGDLIVERHAASVVAVERTVRWQGSRPDYDVWVTDGVLNVDVDCRSVVGTCAVDHRIFLPDGANVAAEIGSGDVRIVGMNGTQDIETGSGDIYLEDLVGTIDLSTGSGDVTGISLASSQAVASTGSGNVDLDLVAEISRVVVDTGSGDVHLDVPAGTYDIRTDTGSGDVHTSEVSSSGSASGSIEVSTGSGDVVINGR